MNPFNFGNIATGKWFIDREKELRDLQRKLVSANKVLLVSPRRYGKTSLAFKVKETLEKDKKTLVVYLDTVACTSLKQFMSRYAQALAKEAESKTDKVVAFFKTLLPSLRPQIQISPEGEISFQFALHPHTPEEDAAFERLLDLPEAIAVKKGKRVVVIMDEFQAIRDLDGDAAKQTLLWKIRSKIQNHRHVGYLFAGSQKHLLEQMAVPKDSPFFRMLDIQRLGKIDEDLFARFIGRLFKESGLPVNNTLLSEIIRRSENVPYYVLSLCNELYELAQDQRAPVNPESIAVCIDLLTRKNHPLYEGSWEKLSSLQKNTLKAVASGSQKVLSSTVMKEFGLSSTGGVQKALKRLIEDQYLYKEYGRYEFDDVWFKEWIKERL